MKKKFLMETLKYIYMLALKRFEKKSNYYIKILCHYIEHLYF